MKCVVLVILAIVSFGCTKTPKPADASHPKDNPKEEKLETNTSTDTPGLNNDEIMGPISDNIDKIRLCYGGLVQREEEAEGQVVMKWTVGAEGKVTQIGVDNATITNKAFHKCLSMTIEKWEWPKPRAGEPVTITYPFVFKKPVTQ